MSSSESSAKTKPTRREVFRRSGMTAAAGLLGAHTAAAAPKGPTVTDTYKRLGVRPFLNLTGAFTMNGGMLTLPEVKEAMDQASRLSIHIDELMEAVGKRLAELLQCEAAIVTSGCSAALTHATSACLAGGDPELIQQLPNLTGLKDEVVMLSRYTYDHAIRTLGVRIVQVSTRRELENALSHRTAMVGMSGEPRGELSLEEIVEVAHRRDVPVLVDAAAHFPESPDPYLSRGVDLITYSGGKMYRGPQCSGFLFGRKDLVDAAWLNGAPHHSFGRAMKVGKEEIMGALAAVEARYSRRDYDQEVEMWSGWLKRVAQRIEQVPGVSTELVARPAHNPHSYLVVSWDTAKIGFTAQELHDVLMDGEPRMQTMALGTGNSFPLRVTNIEEHQVETVAARMHEVFRTAPPPKEKKVTAPATNLTGRWDAELTFVKGTAKHILYLEADGNQIRGTHHGRNSTSELAGVVDGDRVEMESEFHYEGSRMSYTFTGHLQAGAISGHVNLGEYGQGTWTARRHGSTEA